MKYTKMDKARSQLVLEKPFFATILLSMPMTEDPSIPTMATDGVIVKYNKEWVETLTQNEVVFVLAHEVLHCVFDHMGRRGNRTPKRWNQAADYVINKILLDDGIGSMPKVGLHNMDVYNDGGGTAEGIYKLLPADSEEKEPGQKGGSLDSIFDSGTGCGAGPTDGAKIKEVTENIKLKVIAATHAARMQGKLSQGIEQLVTEMLKPQFDWKELLRKFITEKAKNDVTYARPKRRFIAEDIYLPSQTGFKLGKIAIAVDCSGSIYDNLELLNEFAAEIKAIREEFKPENVEVVYFDSKITDHVTVTEYDDFELKPVGGGGTRFSPVIKKINGLDEAPACLVFFTDLDCSDFGQAPDYPVLWCKYGKYKNEAPYGEVIEVNEN